MSFDLEAKPAKSPTVYVYPKDLLVEVIDLEMSRFSTPLGKTIDKGGNTYHRVTLKVYAWLWKSWHRMFEEFKRGERKESRFREISDRLDELHTILSEKEVYTEEQLRWATKQQDSPALVGFRLSS